MVFFSLFFFFSPSPIFISSPLKSIWSFLRVGGRSWKVGGNWKETNRGWGEEKRGFNVTKLPAITLSVTFANGFQESLLMELNTLRHKWFGHKWETAKVWRKRFETVMLHLSARCRWILLERKNKTKKQRKHNMKLSTKVFTTLILWA